MPAKPPSACFAAPSRPTLAAYNPTLVRIREARLLARREMRSKHIFLKNGNKIVDAYATGSQPLEKLEE